MSEERNHYDIRGQVPGGLFVVSLWVDKDRPFSDSIRRMIRVLEAQVAVLEDEEAPRDGQ